MSSLPPLLPRAPCTHDALPEECDYENVDWIQFVEVVTRCHLALYENCWASGCEKKGTKCCAKCNLARFCSKECQKTWWKVHKQVCDICEQVENLIDFKKHVNEFMAATDALRDYMHKHRDGSAFGRFVAVPPNVAKHVEFLHWYNHQEIARDHRRWLQIWTNAKYLNLNPWLRARMAALTKVHNAAQQAAHYYSLQFRHAYEVVNMRARRCALIFPEGSTDKNAIIAGNAARDLRRHALILNNKKVLKEAFLCAFIIHKRSCKNIEKGECRCKKPVAKHEGEEWPHDVELNCGIQKWEFDMVMEA